MTEKELQDYKLPRIDTDKELIDFINEMISVGNSYNTAPYSMALSAYAVFMYVAGKLGVTGFQASWADMQFLKRTRNLEDGFSIIDYSNLLYPQYKDDFRRYSFDNLLRKNLPHLKEMAKVGGCLIATYNEIEEILAKEQKRKPRYATNGSEKVIIAIDSTGNLFPYRQIGKRIK